MNYEDLVINVMKAMSHPVRYNIVKFLYQGPACVSKINEKFEFSQANLSQHLKVLRDSGILKNEKIGLETYYSLRNDHVQEIVNKVEVYVDELLENFKK